jgi:hypothetical protein
LLPLALQAVGKVGVESAQSKALAAFAPHLSGPLLEQAWQTAQSLGGQEARSLALSSLIPSMLKRPEHSLYPLWKQMLPVLAGRTRRDLLADLRTLLPMFLRCGGAESAADVFTAIEEMGRWWP